MEINLDTCLKPCETLETVLSKSFGPNALNTVLSTSTGKLLITTDGATILQALHLANPVSKLITSSVQSHHQVAGDGSKTFVLILSSMLRGLIQASSKERSSSSKDMVSDRISISYRITQLKICDALNSLVFQIFPEHILPQLTLKAHTTLLNDENSEGVKTTCFRMLQTCLQGKLQKMSRDHIVKILHDAILNHCTDVSKLSLLLNDIAQDFDLIFLQESDRPVSESAVIEGVILQRDFVVENEGLKRDKIRFIVIGYMLDDVDDEPNEAATISVRNLEHLKDVLGWKSLHVENIVQQYAQQGVSLLISTCPVSKMAQFICNKYGISVVPMVPSEDAERLARLAGIAIVYESSVLLSHIDIGLASSCKPIIVGTHRYVHLVVDCETNLQNTAFQVLVCGPTPGLSHQNFVSMFNCVKSLQLWAGEAHRSENQIALTFSGGGAFELMLHRLLQVLQKDLHLQKSPNIDNSSFQIACKILSNALLAIPKIIHTNSYHVKSKRTTFLKTLHDAREVICNGGVASINARTGCVVSETVGLESVAGKMLVLQHTVGLLHQLVRVDCVVGVRSQNVSKSNRQDSEEEEEEEEKEAVTVRTA